LKGCREVLGYVWMHGCMDVGRDEWMKGGKVEGMYGGMNGDRKG